MLFKNNAAFERNYSNAGENMRRYLSLYDTFTQRKIFSCDQECRIIPLSKIFYSLDLDFILENLKIVIILKFFWISYMTNILNFIFWKKNDYPI